MPSPDPQPLTKEPSMTKPELNPQVASVRVKAHRAVHNNDECLDLDDGDDCSLCEGVAEAIGNAFADGLDEASGTCDAEADEYGRSSAAAALRAISRCLEAQAKKERGRDW